MATSAERQAVYREQHKASGKRLQAWISATADKALDRLARHHGISRRAMLDELIMAVERSTIRTMSEERVSEYMRQCAR